MNIPLFLKSLTENELNELENHFKHILRIKSESNKYRITLDEFIELNPRLDKKLKNLLTNNILSWRFDYIDEINERDFRKIPNAGIKAWVMMKEALDEFNCS